MSINDLPFSFFFWRLFVDGHFLAYIWYAMLGLDCKGPVVAGLNIEEDVMLVDAKRRSYLVLKYGV